MKRKHIILVLISSVLLALFMLGVVIGSFDFTRSKRLGKTNYYLVENVNVANIWGLCYVYPEMKESFIGILNAYTPEVYWNEEYILAPSCNTLNDSIEEYYIVKMLPPLKEGELGVPWEKIGPLSKEEYEHQKQILHLIEREMKHISLID